VRSRHQPLWTDSKFRNSRHQPLWTDFTKLTADSIGHSEILVTGVSLLSGVNWLSMGLKRPTPLKVLSSERDLAENGINQKVFING
jgi:hypothetical protein